IQLGRMNAYTIKIKEAINNKPADFIKAIERERNKEMDFLEAHKQGMPKSFAQYWAAYYQYYNYFFIQQYPQVHEFVRLKKYTDTVPEINYSVVKEMPYAFNDN